MEVTLWGTRGSLATPGPDTARYGGNTSCVAVRGGEGGVLVLDAGTGIRPLAATLDASVRRVDLLLTHLHMDHIQGLGFFSPLFQPGLDVRIWGPASARMRLKERLMRYLSPPLFPVGLSELPCRLTLHEVGDEEARGAALARLAQFHFARDVERALDYCDAALGILQEDREPVLVAHALGLGRVEVHVVHVPALRARAATREAAHDLLVRRLDQERRQEGDRFAPLLGYQLPRPG